MNSLGSVNLSGIVVSRKDSYHAERAAHRIAVIKVVCAIIIAVCFWYAVPYTFPLQLDPDPMKAAANEAAAYEGSISRQISIPIVMLVSGYGLYRLPRVGRFRGKGRLAGLTFAYIAWAVASLSWSSDPGISVKRLAVFAVDAFFAASLASVASTAQIALFGFVATAVVALVALCADVFVLHSFAPLDPEYRFMGVMTANYQAMNLFICLACGLTLAQKGRRLFVWLSPLLVLLTALLFLTRARIGTFLFVAASIFVVVRLAKQWLQPQGRAVALLIALTFLLPAAAFTLGHSGQNAVSAIFMMGRHDTENTANLSNRAPLWAELLDNVREHPVLGFGYEAFWSPERVQKISADQGWVVPHAHNTYLDQVLSLGVVGCLLYLAVVTRSCSLAWQRYCRRKSEVTLFPALLLSWLALLSCTESIPVAPHLPSLLAYSCIAKMCMADSEEESQDELWAGTRTPGRSTWRGRETAMVGYSPEIRS